MHSGEIFRKDADFIGRTPIATRLALRNLNLRCATPLQYAAALPATTQ